MLSASQNSLAENILPQPMEKRTFFSKLQKQFSSFEDLSKLGKGSQGVVFLIEDLKTKEKYSNS